MADIDSIDEHQVNELLGQLGRMLDGGHKDEALTVVGDLVSSLLRERQQQSDRIRELLKKVYGSGSERIDPRQLQLALEEMRSDQAASKPAVDATTTAPDCPPDPKPRGKRNGRRELPKHLAREEVRILPTAEQLAGKGPMHKVSEISSEVLEYTPAQFKVLVYIRETWANDRGEMVTAPAASKVIEKGLAGPGLLTQVVLAKYKDHTPLHRQVGIFRRDGVELHRNTLVDWIAAVAFLLQPLAKRISELALLAHVLQVDDTHIKTLDRKKAKNIKRARLWCLVGDKRYIAFHYTKNWEATQAEAFLGERIGWLQGDGYKGYETIAQDRPILLVGCWMHCRRYFYKAFEGGDPRAAVVLSLIKKLYKIEEASRDAEDSQKERLARRLEESTPVLNDIEDWIAEHKRTEPPKSLLGKALTYADNHWKLLRAIEIDGALEIDNGDVERILRGPAMGRRNWLFAGSDEGGERTAIILTVLETAARHGVDLRSYLHDILVRISGGIKLANLDELLPENWVKSATDA